MEKVGVPGCLEQGMQAGCNEMMEGSWKAKKFVLVEETQNENSKSWTLNVSSISMYL